MYTTHNEMRAIVARGHGGPKVLRTEEVERPEARGRKVLIKVHAAGVNPVDWRTRRGELRPLSFLMPHRVPGRDVAGVVVGVGDAVRGFGVRDRVFTMLDGVSGGGYAEYAVAGEDAIAKMPENLSFEEAAAVPLAGGTAYEVLVRRLAVRVGETLLIHGGAGGGGSFAVQIARAAGARVIATAGPDNQQTLRDLGADVALDYRQANVADAALEETNGTGVDAVFDCVGGATILESIPATRPFGRLATILGAQGDLTPLYVNNQTLYGVLLLRERARLDEMSLLLERGYIKPLVDEVMGLAQVGEAHRRLESGHGRGKAVLRVS